MILTNGKNNKNIKIFIAALAYKIIFQPFLTLMSKKSNGMQKLHIRVVCHRLWLFGHFRSFQIAVLNAD